MKAMFEADPEKKKELEAKILTEHLPKWLGALDKRLGGKEHKHFFAGDSLSIADFAFASILFGLLFNESNPHAA